MDAFTHGVEYGQSDVPGVLIGITPLLPLVTYTVVPLGEIAMPPMPPVPTLTGLPAQGKIGLEQVIPSVLTQELELRATGIIVSPSVPT
jgi:hypothetical protein